LDRNVIIDKTIHNRPDITLVDKRKKTTYLIDISVPNTLNVQKKYTKKMENCQLLAEEIQNMWQQDKVIMVPVIICTTGVVPKNIHEGIEYLQLNRNMYIQLQKLVLIDTTAIVRR
jgi:acetamidase/formamidase